MARSESMPLLSHLKELRRRVVISAFSIIALSSVGWVGYKRIVEVLASPICNLRAASGSTHCGILYINGVLGPLNLQIKVALLSGVLLAAPIWLYQLWAFTAPGLHKRERKWTVLFALIATPFFAAGASMAIKILPIAVRLLISFTPSSLTNLIKFDDYLDFVTRLILLFGVAQSGGRPRRANHSWLVADCGLLDLPFHRGLHPDRRPAHDVAAGTAALHVFLHRGRHCLAGRSTAGQAGRTEPC
jgi:Tat protein translocase TatC